MVFCAQTPFNKPTDVWVDPKSGDIFITDGYGNSRVHRLKGDGTPILSWGTPGTDPGEFKCVVMSFLSSLHKKPPTTFILFDETLLLHTQPAAQHLRPPRRRQGHRGRPRKQPRPSV